MALAGQKHEDTTRSDYFWSSKAYLPKQKSRDYCLTRATKRHRMPTLKLKAFKLSHQAEEHMVGRNRPIQTSSTTKKGIALSNSDLNNYPSPQFPKVPLSKTSQPASVWVLFQNDSSGRAKKKL